MGKKLLLSSLLIASVQLNATDVAIKYGMSTHQNKRPYQEDRFAHVAIDGSHFFGMYDGHGGDKVSSYLQKQLHEDFINSYVMKKAKTLRMNEQQKFEYAFLKAETYALVHEKDGSTALAVFIDQKDVLHCAWVGDTRAVLEKNGAVGFETRDHKPDDKVEVARIRANGGEIKKYGVWRVGGLAISRSIGDVDIKKECPGQLIAVPEYKAIQLKQDNHFLIMASDGLWDVISSEEAVKMVAQKLKQGGKPSDVAQYL